MTQQDSKKKKRNRKNPPTGKSHLLVVDHPPGMEDLARAELVKVGQKRLKIINTDSNSETALLYQGTPSDLRRLRLSAALYQVYHFPVPRPKGLLGHEHWQRILAEINLLIGRFPPNTFSTFRVAAAGRFSSVFKRIKSELEKDSGLKYDEEEADLQIRVRPAVLHEEGWEMLLRITPRPLNSREWRVFNYHGAVNGVVAAALVEMSQPRPNERVINLMCGSGTLLIERGLRGPAGMLLGGDTNPEALRGAAENITAARLTKKITLAQFDAGLTPLPSHSFDTIIVDPPWGQLVGEQSDPQNIYPDLLQESSRLAAPGAQLLIITHQLKLWEETMAANPGSWTLHESRQLFQGGLHPRIYHYRNLVES